jgi:hypothetical protein
MKKLKVASEKKYYNTLQHTRERSSWKNPLAYHIFLNGGFNACIMQASNYIMNVCLANLLIGLLSPWSGIKWRQTEWSCLPRKKNRMKLEKINGSYIWLIYGMTSHHLSCTKVLQMRSNALVCKCSIIKILINQRGHNLVDRCMGQAWMWILMMPRLQTPIIKAR